MAHVEALVDHLSQAEADGIAIADPHACAAFCLWHDAFYDPQAPHGHNERMSALLCLREARPHLPYHSLTSAIVAIEATATHVAPESGTCPDGELLLDVDLSILGADPEAFSAYDQAIRLEYGHVAEDVYVARRREILSGFLRRPRIFLTDWAHRRWEATARDNMERSIRS